MACFEDGTQAVPRLLVALCFAHRQDCRTQAYRECTLEMGRGEVLQMFALSRALCQLVKSLIKLAQTPSNKLGSARPHISLRRLIPAPILDTCTYSASKLPFLWPWLPLCALADTNTSSTYRLLPLP